MSQLFVVSGFFDFSQKMTEEQKDHITLTLGALVLEFWYFSMSMGGD